MLPAILGAQRCTSGRWVVLLGIVCLATTARADDFESWSHQIVHDPSFKVRVSAVLRLGQLGDPRAAPVLTHALNDEQAAVRTMAANALVRVIDRKVEADVRAKALAALRGQSRSDTDRRARTAASTAVAALEVVDRIARPRRPNNGVFVQVERLADSTSSFDDQTLARLTSTGEDAILAADDTFLVEWPNGKNPTRKQLQQVKARAVAVMATFSSIEVSEQGRRAHVECKLNVILATYPERAARAFVDGKAKLEVGNSSASIERGKRRCARDIITHLLGTRLAADLRTSAR